MSPRFPASSHIENPKKYYSKGRISICFGSNHQILGSAQLRREIFTQEQMSRLSSFRGPSTPTSSPVRQPKQPHNQGRSTPSSPSNQIESTYHRKVRTCLQEIRAVTETWEDLVLLDGLKSLKNLVNTRTDLEYDFFPSPSNLARLKITYCRLQVD